MTISYDAIIIGTGQAGPSLAGRLTAAGMKVAIIERGRFGGTCVNTGCIPTKTMVASAYAAHMARRAAEYDEMLGNNVQLERGGVGEVRHAVDAGDCRHRRPATDIDEHTLRGKPFAADLDLVRRDEPGVTAVVPPDCLLGRRGEQAVLGHTHVLSDSTDISGEVKRRFLTGLTAGVSTPPS